MTTQTVEWISASVKLPDPKINVLLWEWWYEDEWKFVIMIVQMTYYMLWDDL